MKKIAGAEDSPILCERWALRDEGERPGEAYVQQFLDELSQSSAKPSISIFRDKGQELILERVLQVGEVPDVAHFFPRYIWLDRRHDAITAVKSTEPSALDELLEHYYLDFSGTLVADGTGLLSNVPIRWRDELKLDRSEYLLVFWHDGDTLFVLRNECS